MKRTLIGAVAAAGTLMAVMAGTATSANAACVVGVANWDVLWIRARPTVRSSKVGAIPYNACRVRVYWGRCVGSWCRVQYRGVRGWAHTRYLD